VLFELWRADLLYLVSARAERGSPLDWLLRSWRRPVAVHWVGTDVLIAAEAHARGKLSKRVAERPAHWTDAPWLVGELADLGIRAEFLALPVDGLASGAPPLPERFTVLLYLPVDAFDREVFDADTLLALPRELPDARFILVPSPASTLPQPLPANLEARAWVEDMGALYREVTVMARLVSHDGMSFMVLEALSRGRYVVYPFALPGVIAAGGLEEVSSALRGLYEAHVAGRLTANAEGMEWVAREYERDALVEALERRLRELSV
jgi:hypothetical protein